ncbi:MAG: hypothetical protein ACRC5W_03825 [Cetobacterium sp.]
MGVYIRENNFKFDKVDRTYKKETANAVANSIYHIKDTQKISEALGYFLDIYRIDGKKSYEGTKKQFSSHYIPAIELGVIKSSSPYVLSDLAIKMVEAEINPKEYLSIVLLNYFQIIDEKPINLLYQILLLIEKYGNALLLEDIIKEKYFQDKEHTRIAIKILGDSYFFKIEDDKLIFNKSNFSLNELLKITKSEEDNANTYSIDYFKSQQNFSDFLTKFKKPIEFPTLKLEINKNINKRMPYQKIVYGAPGTGKSYKLKQEIDKNFKDIKTTTKVSIDENNVEYWGVGCIFNEVNKSKEMLDKNEWFTDNYKAIEKVKNEVNEGDIIALKSSFTKGSTNSCSRVFGIGKIIKKDSNGERMKVDWLIKYDPPQEFDNVYLSGTIRRIIAHKDKIFSDIINTHEVEEIVQVSKRVTFYDGYTYGQFVGSYKPVMYETENNSKEIGYEFIPGPLLNQILNAYKYPNYDFVLVIEEINRAKADRVFGDIFQLLDRDSNGDSEYPISLSKEFEKYFKDNLDQDIYSKTIEEKKGLYLPNNLYIWATMNSADQGVYPMDTAFKRRWDFEYIPLNKNEKESDFMIKIEEIDYKWNLYRGALNDLLGEKGITEDRLISPFFLKDTDFDANNYIKKESYTNKFLMYLFDDILKHNTRLKELIFVEKNFYKIFDKIEKNEKIYSEEFTNRLKEKLKKPKETDTGE